MSTGAAYPSLPSQVVLHFAQQAQQAQAQQAQAQAQHSAGAGAGCGRVGAILRIRSGMSRSLADGRGDRSAPAGERVSERVRSRRICDQVLASSGCVLCDGRITSKRNVIAHIPQNVIANIHSTSRPYPRSHPPLDKGVFKVNSPTPDGAAEQYVVGIDFGTLSGRAVARCSVVGSHRCDCGSRWGIPWLLGR